MSVHVCIKILKMGCIVFNVSLLGTALSVEKLCDFPIILNRGESKTVKKFNARAFVTVNTHPVLAWTFDWTAVRNKQPSILRYFFFW